MLMEYLEGTVAVCGGLAIIWMNVQKGLHHKQRRKQEKDVPSGS